MKLIATAEIRRWAETGTLLFSMDVSGRSEESTFFMILMSPSRIPLNTLPMPSAVIPGS